MLEFRILGPLEVARRRRRPCRSAARSSARCWRCCSSTRTRSSRPSGSSTSSGASTAADRDDVAPERRLAAAQAPRPGSARHAAARLRARSSTRTQLDLDALRAARARGARGGAGRAARGCSREALALWRGPPLADFAVRDVRAAEIHRLEDLRLAVLEERIDADLELGRDAELVAELEALVTGSPAARAAPRPADARALPVRAAGRGARRRTTTRAGRSSRSSASSPGPSSRRSTARSCGRSASLRPGRAAARSRTTTTRSMRALLAGRLVPVLGPGDVRRQSPASELATLLATRFELPDADGRDLAYVSQARRGAQRHRPALRRAPPRASTRDFEPSLLHGWLAGLPPLLRERGAAAAADRVDDVRHRRSSGRSRRRVRSSTSSSTSRSGRDRGKFLHIGRTASATVVEEPNAYTGSALDERSVAAARSTATSTRSRRASSRASPSARTTTSTTSPRRRCRRRPSRCTLAARLRRSHLLFLGYARRRLEPAGLPPPRLGPRAARIPLVGRAVVGRVRSRASSGVSAASTPTTSGSTDYSEQLARVHRRARGAGRRRMSNGAPLPDGPYKGLARFDDSELDERFFFGRERETGDRRGEPDRLAADRPLRAERGRQELAAAGRRRPPAARARARRRERAATGTARCRSWSISGGTTRSPRSPRAAGTPVPESPADARGRRWRSGRRRSAASSTSSSTRWRSTSSTTGATLAGRSREALAEILTGRRCACTSCSASGRTRSPISTPSRGGCPGCSGTCLRLDHLDVDAARAAIVEPLAELERDRRPATWWPRRHSWRRSRPSRVGPDRTAARGPRDRRGRRAPRPRRGAVSPARDGAALGGRAATGVVGRLRAGDVRRARRRGAGSSQQHLERALGELDEPERELVARLFHQLVTPSGTKIAHGVGDLSRYAGESPERLEDVLHALSDRARRPCAPGRNGGGAALRDLPRRPRGGRAGVGRAPRGGARARRGARGGAAPAPAARGDHRISAP